MNLHAYIRKMKLYKLRKDGQTSIYINKLYILTAAM